jgi:hypothetical protein
MTHTDSHEGLPRGAGIQPYLEEGQAEVNGRHSLTTKKGNADKARTPHKLDIMFPRRLRCCWVQKDAYPHVAMEHETWT